MNAKARFLIGIDAGGSKTKVAVWKTEIVSQLHQNHASEKEILQSASWQDTFPGINLDAIDTHDAQQRLLSILETASYSCQSSTYQFVQDSQVIMGMAGLDTQADRRRAELWLQTVMLQLGITQPNFILIPDVELALWSANPQGVGVVLIAGTGSNCYGRNSKGESAKTGGLSHYFSDEGSGFMLGWEALHALAKMYDGRIETTALLGQVLAAYNVADFPSLKSKMVTTTDPKKFIAQAAPVVQALAAQGEPISRSIVEQQSQELFDMVATVWQKLAESTLEIFLVGGVFKDPFYQQLLMIKLQGKGLRAQFRWIESPVVGAVQIKAGYVMRS